MESIYRSWECSARIALKIGLRPPRHGQLVGEDPAASTWPSYFVNWFQRTRCLNTTIAESAGRATLLFVSTALEWRIWLTARRAYVGFLPSGFLRTPQQHRHRAFSLVLSALCTRGAHDRRGSPGRAGTRRTKRGDGERRRKTETYGATKGSRNKTRDCFEGNASVCAKEARRYCTSSSTTGSR